MLIVEAVVILRWVMEGEGDDALKVLMSMS